MKVRHENENMQRLYTIEDLEDLLDYIPYEIWLKDKSGKHIYINQKGADKLGLKKENIIGKTDMDIRKSIPADSSAIAAAEALRTSLAKSEEPPSAKTIENRPGFHQNQTDKKCSCYFPPYYAYHSTGIFRCKVISCNHRKEGHAAACPSLEITFSS